MISLEAYRACISTFHHKNMCNYKRKFARCEVLRNNYLSETFFSHFIIFLSVLIIMNMTFFEINLLIQHGDIETNPGPTYTNMKSVTGTTHQGDITMFGETAGRQCICNAIYAIAWSMTRRIGLWNEQDLNYILVEGDQLYKAKNTSNFLSLEDLPGSVEINMILKYPLPSLLITMGPCVGLKITLQIIFLMYTKVKEVQVFLSVLSGTEHIFFFLILIVEISMVSYVKMVLLFC